MVPLSCVYKAIRYLCREPSTDKIPNKSLTFWRQPKYTIIRDKSGYGYFRTQSGELYQGRLDIGFDGSSIGFPINIRSIEHPDTVVNKNGEPLHSIFGEIYPYLLIHEPNQWIIHGSIMDGGYQDDFLTIESCSQERYSIIWDYIKKGLTTEFVGVTIERGEVIQIDEFDRITSGNDIWDRGILDAHKEIMNKGWSPMLIEINNDPKFLKQAIFWYIKEESWFNIVKFNMLED